MTIYQHTRPGYDSEDVHAVQLVEKFFPDSDFTKFIPSKSWLVVHQKSGYQQWVSDSSFQRNYKPVPETMDGATAPTRACFGFDTLVPDELADLVRKTFSELRASEPEKPAFNFVPTNGVLVVRMRSPQDVDPALKGLGTEYMLGEVVSCPHRYRLGESGPDYEYPAGTLVAFTGSIVQVLGYTQHPQYLKGNTDARYAVGFAQVIGVFEPRTPAQTA